MKLKTSPDKKNTKKTVYDNIMQLNEIGSENSLLTEFMYIIYKLKFSLCVTGNIKKLREI